MNTEKSKPPVRKRAGMQVPVRKAGWGSWVRFALILVLGLVLAVLLAFRYVGLPRQVSERLDAELSRNGLAVQYSRLYLDPLGRVVARDLVVRQINRDGEQSLEVERLRFSFNWLSWWRGESFLEAASVANADLRVPLDAETAIEVEDLALDVEFRPQVLVVRRFSGRCLGVELRARGRVNYDGFRAGPPMDEAQRAARAAGWRKVEAAVAGIEGRDPLHVDVEGDVQLANWAGSSLVVRVDGVRQAWRDAVAERIYLEARLEEGLARVEGEVEGLRGGLRLEGTWAFGSREARAQFDSDLDLSLLAPVVGGSAGEFLRGVHFRRLPWNEGTLELDWSQGLSYLLQTRSTWLDVSVGGTHIERLYLPFATDGRRMMVPEFEIRGRTGQARGQFFYDGERVLKASLDSSLDPTHFAPLFGPKAKPFFDSLEFRGGGPQVAAQVEGTGLALEGLTASGTLACQDFSYKQVALKEVRSSFRFSGAEIHLPDLVVKREEGEGSGDVRHNFKSRMVWLKGVKARLNLQQTARIIGNKMEEYARPYRFRATPYAEASGTVDVDGQKLTDLAVRVVAPEGMTYAFLGKDIVMADLDADLTFKGSRLEVLPRKPFALFGGKVQARLGIDLTPQAPYTARARLEEVDFGQLMRVYFGNQDVSGSLNGESTLRGRLNDTASIDGFGVLNIQKGVLYDIPIFGGFSDVLNSIIPNLGYAVADKARAEYTMKDGVIQIEKLDVYSAAFALIGNGSYDYVQDKVDLDMRVNARGILGTALFPFSKLFEYQGQGTMNDTKWSPKVF